MTAWHIEPGGVRQVLDDVRAQAESVDGLAGVMTEADVLEVDELLGAGWVYTVAMRGAVAKALVVAGGDLGKMAERVVAGVVGVTAAAVAYQASQEDMAAAEQAMMESVDTGDLSWFVQHGYLEPS